MFEVNEKAGAFSSILKRPSWSKTPPGTSIVSAAKGLFHREWGGGIAWARLATCNFGVLQSRIKTPRITRNSLLWIFYSELIRVIRGVFDLLARCFFRDINRVMESCIYADLGRGSLCGSASRSIPSRLKREYQRLCSKDQPLIRNLIRKYGIKFEMPASIA
jgi:hypothetical protein